MSEIEMIERYDAYMEAEYEQYLEDLDEVAMQRQLEDYYRSQEFLDDEDEYPPMSDDEGRLISFENLDGHSVYPSVWFPSEFRDRQVHLFAMPDGTVRWEYVS